MIVVDTSVLISCIAKEATAPRLQAILVSQSVAIATPTIVETELWMARHAGHHESQTLKTILEWQSVSVIQFTREMAAWSKHAIRSFGKGSGHKAQLNFGDCLSYGVAKALDAPLLFVGNDFSATDLKAV